MTSRTAFLLGLLVAETGVIVVLGKGFRLVTAMNQQLATDRVNHRCPTPLPPLFDQYEMPEMPLLSALQPVTDPALGRSPITLGGSRG